MESLSNRFCSQPHWYPSTTRVEGVYSETEGASTPFWFLACGCSLYGGLYSDFDSIWIRPPPFRFPTENSKNLLRVTRLDNISQPTNFFSNGVMGAVAKHRFLRLALEEMPASYSVKWTSIGSSLLSRMYKLCQCSEETLNVEFSAMYGLKTWKDVFALFNRPIGDRMLQSGQNITADYLERILQSSYQLHLFGKVTNIAAGSVPEKDSLYAKVLQHISMDVSYQ